MNELISAARQNLLDSIRRNGITLLHTHFDSDEEFIELMRAAKLELDGNLDPRFDDDVELYFSSTAPIGQEIGEVRNTLTVLNESIEIDALILEEALEESDDAGDDSFVDWIIELESSEVVTDNLVSSAVKYLYSVKEEKEEEEELSVSDRLGLRVVDPTPYMENFVAENPGFFKVVENQEQPYLLAATTNKQLLIFPVETKVHYANLFQFYGEIHSVKGYLLFSSTPQDTLDAVIDALELELNNYEEEEDDAE